MAFAPGRVLRSGRSVPVSGFPGFPACSGRCPASAFNADSCSRVWLTASSRDSQALRAVSRALFRGREFRQNDLLLFLRLRKAGGAFGQFCAELPLFHADFEPLNRAHLVAQPAVAPRFCRLPAQGIELPDHFADDVLSAHQVLLRLFEFRFRGIAAALEQSDPGGFFYEAAALRRF